MAYIRLAFLALLAIAVATALFYRGQMIAAEAESAQLRADVALAKSVNDENQKAIKKLQDDKQFGDALISSLFDQVQGYQSEELNRTNEQSELRTHSDAVRAWWNSPVPDDIARMYQPKTVSPR